MPPFAFKMFFGLLLKHHIITDKNDETYSYKYNQTKGIIINLLDFGE